MKRSVLLSALAAVLYSTTLWAAEGCTVLSVQGAPAVMRDGQKMDPKPGDQLKKGDVIVANSACGLDMSMNDLAGCRVLADSKLEIAGWKKDNMSVRIVDGNIILNLKKLPEDAAFKVETPTAIAAVRGTQFWGRVSRPTPDNPITTFAVREGVVEITPAGSKETFRLEEGKALDLKLGEAAAVRDALPAEMQAMEQASAIPTQV